MLNLGGHLIFRWILATNFQPAYARRAFPCFDEPAFKAPFEISIARRTDMVALSNMPIRESIRMYCPIVVTRFQENNSVFVGRRVVGSKTTSKRPPPSPRTNLPTESSTTTSNSTPTRPPWDTSLIFGHRRTSRPMRCMRCSAPAGSSSSYTTISM